MDTSFHEQVYSNLLREAEEKQKNIKNELETLKYQYVKAGIIQILADDDEKISLLPGEESVLDEQHRQEKINDLENQLEFWTNRFEKLKEMDYPQILGIIEILQLKFDPSIKEKIQEMRKSGIRPPGPEPRKV